MDSQEPPGGRKLPRPDESPPPGRAVPGRDRGIRQVRRMSNWTAAALIAGTAATTGYFAQASHRTAPPSAAAAARAGSTSSTPPGQHRPCLTVPVATSGGSGVTARVPVKPCGSGTSGASPAIVSVNRPAGHEDS